MRESVYRTLSEQRIDKLVRIEFNQILNTFTQAHAFDRDTKFLLDSKHDAALGGSVELGQYDAGHFDSLGELLGLNKPVLACCLSLIHI